MLTENNPGLWTLRTRFPSRLVQELWNVVFDFTSSSNALPFCTLQVIVGQRGMHGLKAKWLLIYFVKVRQLVFVFLVHPQHLLNQLQRSS